MKKVAIIHGELHSGVQERAVEELSRILLDYVHEYPICIRCNEDICTNDYRCIFIGTKKSNPYIAKSSKTELTKPESYSISVSDDTVMIEGYDDAGVLYGVLDFYNQYIISFEHKKPVRDSNINHTNLWEREKLVDFELTSAPTVSERGLWTWGHVIYDYQKYLHNLMLLKMNSIIIWNDFVPVNARKIVEYAHSCNIKVYWGFSWLWGSAAKFSINNLEDEPRKILEKFEREYANTEGDGIYFQTFTEHKTDTIDGVLIAEAASKFVNDTARLIFERYPKLELQFGLHATSVSNRLEFIRSIDPRIRIVWEDCGAFPFAYDPHEISSFDDTVELVGSIAKLRGENDLFGAVTKGLVNLDWSSFKHQEGMQYIGTGSIRAKRSRVEKMAHQWRYVQAGWLINADKAREMVQKMSQLKKEQLSVFALVEDGLFEENIMYPVALYAQMLWNPNTTTRELMHSVALREYVRFA